MLALALLPVAAGCGGDDDDGGQESGGRLSVLADVSFKPIFEDYGRKFAGARVEFSYADGEELIATARSTKPDVIAGPDPTILDTLWRDALVDSPEAFAGNPLVVVTPKGSEIDSPEDIQAKGVQLALGTEDSVLGRYTRSYLGRIGSEGLDVLANSAAEADTSDGIIELVGAGKADAGIAYLTDVRTTDADVAHVVLPDASVDAMAAVSSSTTKRESAEAFVQGLLDGDVKAKLEEAGFGEPVQAAPSS